MIQNLHTDGNASIVGLSRRVELRASSHVANFSYGNTVERKPVYGATAGAKGLSKAAAPGGRIPSVTVPNYSDKSVSDFIK